MQFKCNNIFLTTKIVLYKAKRVGMKKQKAEEGMKSGPV